MPWDVSFHDEYALEFEVLDANVQDEIFALIELLEEFGPSLKRPHCDTLNGSKHANMKELRFSLPGGVWRVAFAFDPQRCAILLVGGNKTGVSQKKFYKELIRVADCRFDDHLSDLEDDTK